jgi:hypothetical protein
MPSHFQGEYGKRKDEADPEPPAHVGELGIGAGFRSHELRLQSHATDRTEARSRSTDLRMHRAGIDRPRSRSTDLRMHRAGIDRPCGCGWGRLGRGGMGGVIMMRVIVVAAHRAVLQKRSRAIPTHLKGRPGRPWSTMHPAAAITICSSERGRLRRCSSQFKACVRQTAIQIAASCQRPPIVQEDLDRLPVRNPPKNDQSFVNEAANVSTAQDHSE